jgi:hypothetical protein
MEWRSPFNRRRCYSCEDVEDARPGEPIQLRNLAKRAVLVRGKRTTLLWVGLAAMRGQGKFAPGDQFAAFARLRRRRPPLFIRREPYPGHELSLNTLGRPAMRQRLVMASQTSATHGTLREASALQGPEHHLAALAP